MPNYVTFARKGTTDRVPMQQVDDEMREAFGAPPSASFYYRRWDLLAAVMAHKPQDDPEAAREALKRAFDDTDGACPHADLIDWLYANYEISSGYLPSSAMAGS